MRRKKSIAVRIMQKIFHPTALAVVGAIVIGVVSPAYAGKFGVRVVNDEGVPVVGASVCVGLPGNYKQFGALFTDADGQAIVEVPNMPFVVTVSKTRFSGKRMAEPAHGFNLIKQVVLSEGMPGPRCKAGSTLASESSIVIQNVEVSEGVYSTMLKPMVSGDPTHYRVSSTPKFSDAKWRPFKRAIALSLDLSESKSVYLQMRRYKGNSKGWLEARSSIATVQLPEMAY